MAKKKTMTVEKIEEDYEVDEYIEPEVDVMPDMAEPPPDVEPTEKSDEEKEMTLIDVLQLVENAFSTLPLYGPSFYETKHLDIADSLTPTRAYRRTAQLLLGTIEEYFSIRRDLVDTETRVERYKKDVAKTDEHTASDLRRMYAQIDLGQVQLTDLRIRMAERLSMISFLYHEYIKYPAYTRDEFEAAESEYHIRELSRDKTNTYHLNMLDNIYQNSEKLSKKLVEDLQQRMPPATA